MRQVIPSGISCCFERTFQIDLNSIYVWKLCLGVAFWVNLNIWSAGSKTVSIRLVRDACRVANSELVIHADVRTWHTAAVNARQWLSSGYGMGLNWGNT